MHETSDTVHMHVFRSHFACCPKKVFFLHLVQPVPKVSFNHDLGLGWVSLAWPYHNQLTWPQSFTVVTYYFQPPRRVAGYDNEWTLDLPTTCRTPNTVLAEYIKPDGETCRSSSHHSMGRINSKTKNTRNREQNLVFSLVVSVKIHRKGGCTFLPA